MCPLFRAERRLKDSFQYWSEAFDHYLDPEEFVRFLQAAIVNLRSVTFVLQNAKRKVSNFEHWYSKWQDKMRADPVMRWLVNRRNDIEKQGDIEPASKMRLTLCLDWLSEESQELDWPATTSAADAARAFLKQLDIIDAPEGALVRIQREWCHPALPGWELLDALVHCYDFLQEVVLDGHMLLETDFKENCSWFSETRGQNVRLPTKMQNSAMLRSQWYCLDDHSIRSYETSTQGGDEHVLRQWEAEASEHYKIACEDWPKAGSTQFDLTAWCKAIIAQSMIMLKMDGSLFPVFHIFAEKVILPVMCMPRDRADKHALYREIADSVFLHKANAVIFKGEAWQSMVSLERDETGPAIHAVYDRYRREVLSVRGEDIDGKCVDLCVEFTREGANIVFSEIQELRNVQDNSFAPIRAAFKRVRILRTIS
jgi:hypothetical protein